MRQNKDLREKLQKYQNSSIEVEKLPPFLKKLAENCSKNANKHKKAYRYDDFIKETALLFYLLAGKLSYELFAPNLGFPSRATITKRLQNEPSIEEGVLQFDMIEKEIRENNLPRVLVFGDDDTKIIDQLSYDIKHDEIIGLQLPMDDNGMPIPHSFKFVSIRAAQEYLRKHRKTSYLKLIACRSLHPNGKVYPVLIYGTNGGEKAETIVVRNKYIFGQAKSRDLLAVGYASDGLSPQLRSMQMVSGIPNLDSNCPEIHKWWFCADWKPDYLNIQDPQHIGTKMYRALVSRIMPVGEGVACQGVLLDMIKSSDRGSCGLSIADIEVKNKDQMDFSIVKKVSSARVIDNLTNEEEIATKLYLKLIHHIIRAYIDADTEAEKRVEHALIVMFFCRMWKDDLQMEIDEKKKCRNKRQSDFKPTIKDNFITSNVHTSIEINAHNLVLFLVYCRDSGHPEYFLVYLFNSQQNEHFFRFLRSCTSIKITQIVANLATCLQKSKRMRVLEDIFTNIDPTEFNMTSRINTKLDKVNVPSKLPTDQEINEIAKNAWKIAQEMFLEVGVEWNGPPPKINISKLSSSKTSKKSNGNNCEEDDDEQDEDNIENREHDFITAEDFIEESDEMLEISEDLEMLENYEQLKSICQDIDNNSCQGVKVLDDEKLVPKGHFGFSTPDGNKCISKRTTLFFMESYSVAPSSDRRIRYRGEKSAEELKETVIKISEWILMKHSKKNLICKVLGFEYKKKRNYKYKKMFCPTNHEGDGMMVLVISYKKSENSEYLEIVNDNVLINIKNYIRHAVVRRDKEQNKYILNETL